MIQSPLNYTGGKFKLLPQILPYFPKHINTFVDLFCGGCNVGINVTANQYIYNDICEPLIKLYSVMNRKSTDTFIDAINKVIDEYHLSDIKTYGYDFYGCNSSNGLSDFNRDKFLSLRQDFNAQELHNDEYYIKLYVLIVYAFNNQIRFNRKGDFNLPPGKRDFNKKMYDKLIEFMTKLHEQQNLFMHSEFTDIDLDNLDVSDFVYADPPYLITCASYNEQGGWCEKDEYNLLELLDSLNERNIRFALSNVLESKGKTNQILANWIALRSNYRMIELNYSYNNANYQRKNSNNKTREILVMNY